MSVNQAKCNTVVMPKPTETEVRDQNAKEEVCSFPVYGSYEANTLLGADGDSDTDTIYFTDNEGQEVDKCSDSNSPRMEQDCAINRDAAMSQESLIEGDSLEGYNSMDIVDPTDDQECEIISGQPYGPPTRDEDINRIMKKAIKELVDKSLLDPGDIITFSIIRR